MGAKSSHHADERRGDPPAPIVPDVDRETTPIAEKETAAEFAFMLENMRMKQWASEEDNLQRVRLREDNSAFGEAYAPTRLPLDAEGF
eukprot:923495-Prymnesium_polylepis.1